MQRAKKASLIVFVVGTCLSLFVLLGALLFLNADQCPTGYTQQQIDETGCIIGANIGLGVAILLSVALETLTAVAVIIILAVPLLKKLFSNRKHS